jgi:hypothetical protein
MPFGTGQGCSDLVTKLLSLPGLHHSGRSVLLQQLKNVIPVTSPSPDTNKRAPQRLSANIWALGGMQFRVSLGPTIQGFGFDDTNHATAPTPSLCPRASLPCVGTCTSSAASIDSCSSISWLALKSALCWLCLM